MKTHAFITLECPDIKVHDIILIGGGQNAIKIEFKAFIRTCINDEGKEEWIFKDGDTCVDPKNGIKYKFTKDKMIEIQYQAVAVPYSLPTELLLFLRPTPL